MALPKKGRVMWMRFAGLLRKDIIQFLRDRVMLILVLWLYTGEVVVCALALSFEIANLPLAVVDLDHTPASRVLVDDFLATQTFLLAGRPALPQVTEWLQSGRARVAVSIREEFQRRLARGETGTVQVLLDGTNSNVAAQARSYALQIVSRFRPPPQAVVMAASGGALPVVRVWYNPSQTYTSFIVLSMIAIAALMVGVFHPAASFVREKESGTIEQLRVTPIGTAALFVAKVIPTLLIGLLSVFPSLLIAWWFGVPLRGSLALFLGFTALFLVSAIAMGSLVAAVSKTLQQALLLSFFGLFPLMFLSGTIVPVESMPLPLQVASLASPVRHYLDVMLGLFLKGSGVSVLWPHALALVAIGVPLFVIAALIFQRSYR
jgi:ABC-2 type transport system permease protein